MYKPFLCFLDPVFIACLDETHLEMINIFCNRINEIENDIYEDGDEKEFFKIPIKQGMEDELLNALFYKNQFVKNNQQLTRVFSYQFLHILQRLFVEWDISEVCVSPIYVNSQLDEEIKNDFNNFLCACSNIDEFKSGNRTFPHSDIFPFYISSQTTIIHSRFHSSRDSNEIFDLIPYKNFFYQHVSSIGSGLTRRLFRHVIELAQNQGAVRSVDELNSFLERFQNHFNLKEEEFNNLVRTLRPSDAETSPDIELKKDEPKHDKRKRGFISRLAGKFPYITVIRDGKWNQKSGPYILRLPSNQIEIGCPFAKDYNFPFYITTTAQSELELLIAEKEIWDHLSKHF